MADDLKRTLREVKQAGWAVTQRGKHLLIEGPDGQRVVCTTTYARGRAHANLVSQLKRAGLDLRKHHDQPKRRRRRREPEENPT